jgi:hypothetical protein
VKREDAETDELDELVAKELELEINSYIQKTELSIGSHSYSSGAPQLSPHISLHQPRYSPYLSDSQAHSASLVIVFLNTPAALNLLLTSDKILVEVSTLSAVLGGVKNARFVEERKST